MIYNSFKFDSPLDLETLAVTRLLLMLCVGLYSISMKSAVVVERL